LPDFHINTAVWLISSKLHHSQALRYRQLSVNGGISLLPHQAGFILYNICSTL